MKRIIAIILSVLMLTSLVVLPTAAETDPLDGCMTVLGHQATVKPTGTDGNDKLYAIRIVAAHTKLDEYSSFGYEVTVKYTDVSGKAVTKTLKTPVTGICVYQELSVSGGGSIKASDYENAEYISGVEITNVPASAGNLTIEVTPFVVYLNSRGTVKGDTKTLTHDLTVTTMTFNIRNWEQQTNNHLERLILTIKAANYPDVIGFQEMGTSPEQKNWDWRAKIMADAEIAACYDYAGVSRGDTTGESCIIFYKKDKFELIETETRWLYCEHGVTCTSTACTGETTAGALVTKSELDADDNDLYYRIVTYAKLKRKSDSQVFCFLNTHLEIDGYANNIYGARTIKNKQIQYLLNFAKTLTDAGYPVIVTGDFNASTNSTVLNSITNAGYIRTQTSAYHTVGAEVPSNSQYTYCGNTTVPYKDIDHIFIHAENVFVRQFTFCDQPIEYGGTKAYASDHIPRIAEYIIW